MPELLLVSLVMDRYLIGGKNIILLPLIAKNYDDDLVCAKSDELCHRDICRDSVGLVAKSFGSALGSSRCQPRLLYFVTLGPLFFIS